LVAVFLHLPSENFITMSIQKMKSDEILTHFHSKTKTIEERIAAGKALREKFPRANQAIYQPSAKRVDPVAVLEKQAETRLQDLIPVRYARMLASPFAFLRGSAAVMAADLAASGNTSSINVAACGDMHVSNFGVFASAERKLIFGINDFDEAHWGAWEWDLKRLTTSIVSSGRFVSFSDKVCEDAIYAAVNSYRKHMKDYAEMGYLQLWYETMSEKAILNTLDPKQKKAFSKLTDKARTRTHMQVLDKLTDVIDDKYRLREDAPFIVRETHVQNGMPVDQALGLLLESYMQSLTDDRQFLLKKYRIADVARKVVGVGSVGTRCWIILLTGNHDDDPLFLQVKEAQPSVLEPFTNKTIFSNEGQRIVAIQRLIQGAPDIFLGWGQLNEHQFYVRQLRDMKGSAEFVKEGAVRDNFVDYCKLCGWALAQAHAKSGDAAMIAGYAGNSEELDEAMAKFAFAYAEQTEKDYDALVKAAKSGRVKVAAEAE